MIIHTPGRVSYQAGLELQEAARARVVSGGDDELLLLEHERVVTMGRRGGVIDRAALERLETPVIETDRGGLATWHGPGQLVGYPIVDLSRRGLKVPEFVAVLGSSLAAVAVSLGVADARYDHDLPGVFVGDRKLAAIGLHLRRNVSTHGFALNVNNDLEGFGAIVPCGLTHIEVTTLVRELDTDIDLQGVLERVGGALLERLTSRDVQKGDRARAGAPF